MPPQTGTGGDSRRSTGYAQRKRPAGASQCCPSTGEAAPRDLDILGAAPRIVKGELGLGGRRRPLAILFFQMRSRESIQRTSSSKVFLLSSSKYWCPFSGSSR